MTLRRYAARIVQTALSASWLFCCAENFGQGQISFVNYVPLEIDARVTFADGTPIPASAGYTAQLYGAPTGSSLDILIPLFPTAGFRRDVPGYIYPEVVTVEGKPAGTSMEIVMRVYSGQTWESSSIRGESNLLDLTLGGGLPPATKLLGMQPFSVYPVPEPSTLVLVVVGGAVFVVERRRFRAVRERS